MCSQLEILAASTTTLNFQLNKYDRKTTWHSYLDRKAGLQKRSV
jgi:hypothetical protein